MPPAVPCCRRSQPCAVQDPDGLGYHAYANVSAAFSRHWREVGIPVYEEIWNEPDLTECALNPKPWSSSLTQNPPPSCTNLPTLHAAPGSRAARLCTTAAVVLVSRAAAARTAGGRCSAAQAPTLAATSWGHIPAKA